MNPPIPEERMAVINTSHLPEDEADSLAAYIDSGDINGMYRDEGWMVYTNQDALSTLCRQEFPVLVSLLAALSATGYIWVLFDRDGETVPYFPVFEW